ncbi:MAG: glycosyltransferase family 2 protein [Planctomycetota bacterium]
MIDLSVVIVNWNTRRVIGACLDSVFKGLGDLVAEVIVIDNASADHSAQMIAHEFPQVRLIDNDTNRGFAAANNQGIRIARGRHVLLLNPDTVVIGDVLEKALAYARAHPDAGLVGCQVMEGPMAVQRTCFRFPSPLNTFMWVSGLSAAFPRSRLAGRAAYGPWQRDGERDVDVVSGMFMLVRREAIAQVGPMDEQYFVFAEEAVDEQYFVFAEEADWCRRFRDAGWRCVFAPVGRILHVDGGSKSTEQADVRMYVQLQESVLRFHRKHLGVARWLLAKGLFATSMIARAAWWRLWAALGVGAESRRKARLSAAAARYHLTGREPAW